MVSGQIRSYLKKIGQRGGNARARKLSADTRSAHARHAIISRWMRKRFGADRFESLALPGWEIIDPGLHDLVHGNISSINALAVVELRPRLRLLGVPVPDVSNHTLNSREQLFCTMKEVHGDMAYLRFCALLERLDSFCDALAGLFPIPQQSTHKQRRWCA
jgi:hypothetical protein